MKYILLIFISVITSLSVSANPYIGISYQEIDSITSQPGFSKKEGLTGITIGGLNINRERATQYMKPSWEISVDFSENAFNSLHQERYTQISLTNISINLPLNNDSYLKFGAGVLKSNIVLSNGYSDEDERIFNIRLGAGYRIFNQIILGAHFDTSTKSPSLQLGYLFK